MQGFLATRSPDLNLWDYYKGGYLKDRMYLILPITEENLKVNITWEISKKNLESIILKFKKNWNLLILANGVDSEIEYNCLYVH